jgi:four helix bundle protein
MAGIKTHEDLMAWQLSEELKDRVFEFTARPWVARHRDFCDDIRRSARSAPANLSEGFYRFRPRDNAKFVRYALGSLGESKNHLRHARKENDITEDEFQEMWRFATRAIGAATKWHQYLRSCPPDGPEPKPQSHEPRTP